jgi:phosphopantetheinyl transferase (holo-ACP synthase)
MLEMSSTEVRIEMAAMAPIVRDFDKLLEGVPRGAWVAISHDEDRVVAYAAELKEAISKAQEQGEQNPVIVRVPQSSGAFLF